MKVIKLHAENVKKLKAVSIDAGNEAVLKITGANEQGKTTVLDCIWWALGGTKNIQDQPIRNGEKKAKITLDLGDMVVIRKFTEKASTLEVTNKEGAVFKSPQTILDGLIGKFSFDPLKFSKGDKKEQVETLLNVSGMKVDAKKLKEISGCEIAEMGTALDILNTAYSEVFGQRTIVNREVDSYKKIYESFGDIEKVEAVNISSLLEQKEAVKSRLHAVYLENKKHNSQLREEYNSAIEKERKENQKWNNLQADYQVSINQAYDSISILKGLGYDGNELDEWFKSLPKPEAQKTEITTPIPVYIEEIPDDKEIRDIDMKISESQGVNELANKWTEKQKAKQDYTEAEEKSKGLTKKLEMIIKYKQDLVASAKFPIDGLNFENGGVTYQGVPFDQSSSAQKLTVSLAVAMALNPTLKVIRIDDGSLLDSKHMAIIEQMAKDQDYQIWMECVDESGKVGIYIEDGEVKSE